MCIYICTNVKDPFRREVFLLCFLKCLDIQWRTEPVYTEKFLINEPNDLGLLPPLSFPETYVLYKLENRKSTQPLNVLYIHQILIYVHELAIPEHTHPP